MHPAPQPYDTAPVPTPITINHNGQAVPPSATISIANNDGAIFNASFPCTLTFSPSCPFQGASGNVLSLNQGHNTETLIQGVAQQTYTYTVSDPPDGPPQGEQFDVVVSP